MQRQTFWQKVRGFFVKIKDKLPFLYPDEQSWLSWLSRIRSLEDLPEIYRSVYQNLVGENPFPYTLLTPSYQGFSIRGKEKMIFCQDGHLFELVIDGGAVKTDKYPIRDVIYIEEGRALLQSWVNIFFRTEDKADTLIEYKFNTVSEHLFAPFLHEIRAVIHAEKGSDLPDGELQSEIPDDLSIKLRHYINRSIFPGSRIIQIVVQSEIRKQIIRLFGKTIGRTICPTHVSILTDQELILIQEGTGERKEYDHRYGGVYHYIPLNRITSIDLTLPKDGVFTRSISLGNEIRLNSIYSENLEPEVEELLSQIRR